MRRKSTFVTKHASGRRKHTHTGGSFIDAHTSAAATTTAASSATATAAVQNFFVVLTRTGPTDQQGR